MVVVLHNIRSLHNVGSIFRTADALGIEKIYLCGITPEPTDRFGKFREQLTKVSLGAEKTVPWEKIRNTSSLIAKLKRDGWRILAVEQAKNSKPYYKLNRLPKKVVLIMGNEVKGLSPSVLNKSDVVLEIPMKGKKESLNVSVAFGIVASQLIYN